MMIIDIVDRLSCSERMARGCTLLRMDKNGRMTNSNSNVAWKRGESQIKDNGNRAEHGTTDKEDRLARAS